jgi:hypothetical protein
MKTIGRNDPCPCGSGKKYKKCCIDVAAATDSEFRRKERIEDTLTPRLVEYALDTFGVEALQSGWESFNGVEGIELPEDDAPINLVFMPWYLFNCELRNQDSPTDPSMTIAEAFWTEYESDLTQDEIDYLDGAIGLPYSIYEVIETKPTIGLKVRDLFTQQETEVVDRNFSSVAVNGVMIYGAILEFGKINSLLAILPLLLPHEFKDVVLDARKALTDELERDELTWADVVDFEAQIRMLYFELMSEMVEEFDEQQASADEQASEVANQTTANSESEKAGKEKYKVASADEESLFS